MALSSFAKSIELLVEYCPDIVLLLFFQVIKVYSWVPLGLRWIEWLKVFANMLQVTSCLVWMLAALW